MSAGIVGSAGHELAFRHDLLWEAVTESLSTAVRRALHREAGEMLLKRGGSAVPAAAHLIHSTGHGDVHALLALTRRHGRCCGPRRIPPPISPPGRWS